MFKRCSNKECIFSFQKYVVTDFIIVTYQYTVIWCQLPSLCIYLAQHATMAGDVVRVFQ